MKRDWNGKTAVITGASSGLGASFAQFLAQAGIHVVLVARREERLKKLREEIQVHGGKASIYSADLSSEKERETLVNQIRSEVGTVDILINNAGFGWYGFFQDMKWPLAKQMANVNMGAVIHLTHLFLPQMLERKTGHIINIGSIAGALPNQGIVMYSASKAFLDAFTSSLYRELKRSGVSISIMRLGPVRTEFFKQAKELENGGTIPAEKFAISTEQVNTALWNLMNHPSRAVYVPRWLAITKHVENLFGWAIDLLGPLLLNRSKKSG